MSVYAISCSMKKVKLNGHKVVIYDSIDELPIVRFHKYSKMLLVDAGVGSDINDCDAHIERATRYIRMAIMRVVQRNWKTFASVCT